jgi:hypothetical protein
MIQRILTPTTSVPTLAYPAPILGDFPSRNITELTVAIYQVAKSMMYQFWVGIGLGTKTRNHVRKFRFEHYAQYDAHCGKPDYYFCRVGTVHKWH